MAFDVQDPSKDDYISMSLHDMFRIIGDQITQRDLKVLKFISSAFISDEMLSNVHTGYDFFLCMEAMNRVTESNFRHVLDLLRIISRHDMSQFVNLRRRHPVIRDPVCEYLDTANISIDSSSTSCTKAPENSKEPKNPKEHENQKQSTCTSDDVPSTSSRGCSYEWSPGITDASTSSSQATNDSTAVGEKQTFADVDSKSVEDSSEWHAADSSRSPLQKRRKIKCHMNDSDSEEVASKMITSSSCENVGESSTCSSEDKQYTDVAHEKKIQGTAPNSSHSSGEHAMQLSGNIDDRETINTTSSELSSNNEHQNEYTEYSNIKGSCSTPNCETEFSFTDENTNCEVLGRTDSKLGINRAASAKGDNCAPSAASCSTSTSLKSKDKCSVKSNTDCDSKTELTHMDPSDPKMESSPELSKDCKPELSVSNGDSSNSQLNENVTSSAEVACNQDSSDISKTELPAPDGSPDGAGGSDKDKVTNKSQESSTDDQSSDAIKKKYTCDIRLRVRAEYCQHNNALEGNVFSNKPTILERQFEKFTQANTILKSRDLGSIVCDIKFSELTYLDAFWRDYINGSLLEALKGVFLTDSLKQAVGHEAIKLLVNVDEDDYDSGRLQLLKNLVD